MGNDKAAHGNRLGEAIEKTARRLIKQAGTTRVGYGRDFAALLALLSPRIARLIRQYRLNDMKDDAQQAAAIGVHRAVLSYDPAKAQFSTHVTWQIRGELQALRHRMRLDQRASARNAGVSTVSLDAMGIAGEEGFALEIADDAALPRTESGASDTMALSLMDRLLDTLKAPADERAILFDDLLDREPPCNAPRNRTSEQRRQVMRRTYRNCIKVLAA